MLVSLMKWWWFISFQFRTLTYSLVANAAGNNLFQINSLTGDITTRALLSSDPTITHTVIYISNGMISCMLKQQSLVTIYNVTMYF